jgi:hypothetical protein
MSLGQKAQCHMGKGYKENKREKKSRRKETMIRTKNRKEREKWEGRWRLVRLETTFQEE